jgi:hypothetical protein
MQVGLMSAIFDRMERANWTIASHFPRDRATAAGMKTRPEVFWRQMLETAGSEVVTRALRVADTGVPNRNHELIAHFLSVKRCRHAITTNFDEHVEALLPKGFQVETPDAVAELPPAGKSIITKLHGTASDPNSLVFTLEQYDALENRNTQLLQRLSGQPLVIAGYSGYDTDVLPALSAVVCHIPLTIILKHPGSHAAEPVLGLATSHPNVIVLEAKCSEVLSILADGAASPDGPLVQSRSGDQATIYREASEATHLYMCPFLLVAAFGLDGFWTEVHRYAWLTHDACCDALERAEIAPEEFRSIHLHLAYSLQLYGDASGSRIMLAEARSSLDNTGGKPSEAMAILRTEAMIRNAPNQNRTTEDGQATGTEKPSRFSPSAILAAQDRFHQDYVGAKGMNSHDVFIRAWQLGIARRRDGDAARAVEAFDPGMEMVTEGIATHLERGRFLLDYGGALYQWAIENESPEFREKANAAYQMSASITSDIGDWVTNARAHLMLARIYLSATLVERSQASIKDALEAVAKTNDSSLRSRIEEFSDALMPLRRKTRERGSAED